METDPAKRFSSRVADYVRYRPSYPPELVPWIADGCGLTPQYVIADIGSGTGLFAAVFLRFGCRVYGVEAVGQYQAALGVNLSLRGIAVE
jgi:predicted RNA methylase